MYPVVRIAAGGRRDHIARESASPISLAPADAGSSKALRRAASTGQHLVIRSGGPAQGQARLVHWHNSTFVAGSTYPPGRPIMRIRRLTRLAAAAFTASSCPFLRSRRSRCPIRRRGRLTTSTPIMASRSLIRTGGWRTTTRRRPQPGSRRRTRSRSAISTASRSPRDARVLNDYERYSAPTHAAVSGELSSSSHRYGSTTWTPVIGVDVVAFT